LFPCLPAFLAAAWFIAAEAFSRAGYFTIECEAPNPRLYSFEGAICCWDFPPTYNPHPTITPSRQTTATAAARGSNTSRGRQEVEMAATAGTAAAAAGGATGSGWYASAGREHEQQQQQQQGGSPKSRRGGSPSRRRQAAGHSGGGVDSVTAALGEYGQQVGYLM
jgi:hypothetical protein